MSSVEPTERIPLERLLVEGERPPSPAWRLAAIRSGDCISYVAWNEQTREALAIDPKEGDYPAYLEEARKLEGYVWLAVIDTHTHADHISAAARLAEAVGAPLVMHQASPSPRVRVRVSAATHLPAHAASVRLLPTPGHTQDSLTVLWGPFLFGGDTVLFGDVGRDDLPGGDPEAHFESLTRLKDVVPPETIVLPGHDSRGGRASSWAAQLRLNSSLTEGREDYVREAAAFDAPAPKLLKQSLHANFR
jgi:glyoxylase-like metal-dependent hydrolase (beta-lactamase superfamily II)